MNKELFILTIIMLGWKKVDQLTYNKNGVFILVNKPYLQIQTKKGFITVLKYQDILDWINENDTQNIRS